MRRINFTAERAQVNQVTVSGNRSYLTGFSAVSWSGQLWLGQTDKQHKGTGAAFSSQRSSAGRSRRSLGVANAIPPVNGGLLLEPPLVGFQGAHDPVYGRKWAVPAAGAGAYHGLKLWDRRDQRRSGAAFGVFLFSEEDGLDAGLLARLDGHYGLDHALATHIRGYDGAIGAELLRHLGDTVRCRLLLLLSPARGGFTLSSSAQSENN